LVSVRLEVNAIGYIYMCVCVGERKMVSKVDYSDWSEGKHCENLWQK
jgi:hypothetical protein